MPTLRNILTTRKMKTKLPVIISICVILLFTSIKAGLAQPLYHLHGLQSVHPGVVESQVLGRMPENAHLDLAISLPVRDPGILSTTLLMMYDPKSLYYHRYLTSQQFVQMFSPTPVQYDLLVGYLKSHGFTINSTDSGRMIVDVGGSVATIEQAFHVHMLIYQHPTENRTFFGPDAEPTIDQDLPILDITGLDNYELPRSYSYIEPQTINSEAGGSGPSGLYQGFDFRSAYCPQVSLDGTGQYIALFQLGGYFPSDISEYCSQVGLPQANITPELLDGVTNPPAAGSDTGEQSIDIEMAHSMAPGAKILFYYGSNAIDIWNQIASDDLAKQVSSSWSVSPPPSTLDQTFQRMGVQGQSVFNASGDSGFQASAFGWLDDAYITLVGGTVLSSETNGGVWESETGWNGSGGYISPNYSIPSWQVGVANSANEASTTQRNVPDVAMIATNIYCIANDGATFGIGGTSCASPLWAGFLSLVNEQATAYTQPTAGFINPAVYALGAGPDYNSNFHDITSGSNGMPTTTGYDLVTGWGSPTGQTLIDTLSGVSYTIAVNPGSLNLNQGTTATSTISVVPTGGFSSNVIFSATGLPSGVTASFSPTSSTTSTVLTLTATRAATTGPATITITGTSGPVSKSTTINLTVLGNYTLSASPTSVTINQGTSGTSSVTVVPTGGFSSSVAFSATGLPSGVSASFSPSSSTTGSTLTLTASNTAAVGTATVTITGTSGSLVNMTTISVTVNPNYTLQATPSSLTINQRTSGTSAITIAPNGAFAGTVSFTASGLPSGVTASFSPTSSTTGTVLTLSASATAATGSATVTITGTSGPFSEQTTIALTVNGNYTLTANPTSVTINQRTSGTSTITVVPTGGFADSVTYTATGLPNGVTAFFSPASSTTSALLTLSASATATTGTSTVTIIGTSGSLSNSTTVSLTVLGNYTISATPAAITLKQNKNTTSTIAVLDTGGFTGSVAFTASGLPSGVAASFSPASSGSSSILTLTASPTAAIGTATVTITGTSGTLVNTATIALTIAQGWTITSFTLNPSTVVGGNSTTGAITLSDPTPAGGEAIALSVPASTAAYLSFPATVTVAAGQTSITFGGIQTHTAVSTEATILTATLGTSAMSATLTMSFVEGGTQAGGMTFFSSPWAYDDLLKNIFENLPASGEIAGYNAATASYVYEGGSAASPTPVTITPGNGYWANFPADGESLLYLGTPVSSTVPTTVSLSVGYNAIGDPYTTPVNISALTFGSTKTTFSQASRGLISPMLYYYTQGLSGSYTATGAGGALTPGKGYWIYAFSATTVTFPLP